MGSVVVIESARNKYTLVIILILFLVAGGVSVGYILSRTTPVDERVNNILGEQKKIGRIDAGNFNFVIADSAMERQRGLSGMSSLPPTDAMLFVFESPAKECMWMKDMRFNIDILWFDEDKKLIHQELNASKESYPQKFCPDKPAKYVVEVAAGVAEKNQINIGDALEVEL